MRILDYLQSTNVEMFCCGLKVLNVDEELIEKYRSLYFFSSPSPQHYPLYLFFLGVNFTLCLRWQEEKMVLSIINQIADYEIINEDALLSMLTIKFIKLKEINYD